MKWMCQLRVYSVYFSLQHVHDANKATVEFASKLVDVVLQVGVGPGRPQVEPFIFHKSCDHSPQNVHGILNVKCRHCIVFIRIDEWHESQMQVAPVQEIHGEDHVELELREPTLVFEEVTLRVTRYRLGAM